MYLEAITVGKIRGYALKDAGKKAVVSSLSSKGLLIKAAKGKEFLPVHPRLALSNLFRIYEERALRERKERRLNVDRMSLELIPIYEKSKDTNSPSPEEYKDERA